MKTELPERKKRVLCSNIKTLEILYGELIKRYPQQSNASEIGFKMQTVVKEIKEQALAMEKRLYLYKETIESLGFKRVRKRN